ncbi:MAG: MerR family DNA-binding protein [Burkholderiales bacterium]|nr:MerR family DNA-binding protein [Burkholderiales bacterium]
MRSEAKQLTIGRLARAAEVGVETIRYYQSIGLIPTPEPTGTYRYYPVTLVDRIRFVKRGQQLGLSLAEIAELIRLNDGMHRAAIRGIAKRRMVEIDNRINDLQKIRSALATLVNRCAHTKSTLPCPIIESLAAQR